MVAQKAVNINNEIFTLFVGTPFACAALKLPPVEYIQFPACVRLKTK